MPTTITSVTETAIRYANFIAADFSGASLDIGAAVEYFSDADRVYTVDGNEYISLGYLLNVSEISQSFRSTQSDVSITIDGANFRGLLTSAKPRGGEVSIKRCFFNASGEIIETIDVFRGIISNVALDESIENRLEQTTLTLSCVSIDSVLEKTVSGQRTNGTSRRKFYPGDISFDRVAYVQNSKLGFKQ